MINYEDFSKVEIRVGKIIGVEDFLKAHKSAYKLLIDFGPQIGMKKSSAQITDLYKKSDLEGKLIIAVTNFPPKQIADFMSEVLVLGAADKEERIVLMEAGKEVPPGSLIH